jgi:hypothetical protein
MADPEIDANAALSMDRGIPLGNSLDTFNRRALHVKVGNKVTEPIPVYIADSEPGTPIFFDDNRNTTPGVTQSLISFVVPAHISRDLYSCVVVCRSHGYWRLTLNSRLIASGRTGPAQANTTFDWKPRRTVSSGDSIELTFQSVADSSVKGVEAYLMASDSSV